MTLGIIHGKRLTKDGEICRDYSERLRLALMFYNKGIISAVIVSGAATRPEFPSEAEVGCTWLQEQGVPSNSLIKEEQSHTTFGNIRNCHHHIMGALVRGDFPHVFCSSSSLERVMTFYRMLFRDARFGSLRFVPSLSQELSREKWLNRLLFMSGCFLKKKHTGIIVNPEFTTQSHSPRVL